jgi:hypothetical protein
LSCFHISTDKLLAAEAKSPERTHLIAKSPPPLTLQLPEKQLIILPDEETEDGSTCPLCFSCF